MMWLRMFCVKEIVLPFIKDIVDNVTPKFRERNTHKVLQFILKKQNNFFFSFWFSPYRHHISIQSFSHSSNHPFIHPSKFGQ